MGIEDFEQKHSNIKFIKGSEKAKTAIKSFWEDSSFQRATEELFKKMGVTEREKTLQENKLIELANNATNEILLKYNILPIDVSPESIYLLADDDFRKIINNNAAIGGFNPDTQGILVNDCDSLSDFGHVIFHELMHFKSFQVFEISNEDETEMDLNIIRTGMKMRDRGDRKIKRFGWLNEAITEDFFRRFFDNKLKDALSTEDEETTTKSKSVEIKLSDKEWDDLREFREAIITEEPYGEERLALDRLIKSLYLKNKNKFENEEEIFDLFAKSFLNGNLLPIGKLIDRTFSKGTFRKIGELDSNAEKLEELIDTL